ncbi:unnamed protein product [Eruca vesicaria subsp. sativa]|uniref:Uncharacterized protein n=1 Tax=Eruca vesicaria subsp. sativa TaxID=29727 RepID=A0ABC8LW35_ERUVS|nr:unnamed protein product [Eruca vesicaria subsp. sativa]
MSLADDPVLIEDGKKSFWLEKGSGKMCYMLSAMDLKIVCSDWPDCWQWKKDPDSNFEKVVKLRGVIWFEIQGKIGCGMLSKGTHYSVYLVFKIARRGSHGFKDTPMDAQVGFVGKDASETTVLLEPSGGYRYINDGWSEVKLGNCYINDGGCDDDDDDDEIEFSIMETQKGHWKSGLIFQGIEIRPKTEEMVIAK